MIRIYECDDSFLYEIIEDYKEAKTEEEKDDIFKSFCSSIWSSDNKRRIYKKSIRFNVRKDLLHTEVGQVFDTWSDIEYTYYKSMTKDENWRSIVRQKINNIYTKYFDKMVILDAKYMMLLKTPKKLYYQWISGIDMDIKTVTKIIDDAIDSACKIKVRLQKEKMSLSWGEYKKIIEGFLRRCFDNCKLIEEYEDKTKINSKFDFLTEDHFYVGYVCRYLDREIIPYQKKYYGVRQHKKYLRCKNCGSMVEKTGNKRMYCDKCAKMFKEKSNKIADKKYKNKKRENRKM